MPETGVQLDAGKIGKMTSSHADVREVCYA